MKTFYTLILALFAFTPAFCQSHILASENFNTQTFNDLSKISASTSGNGWSFTANTSGDGSEGAYHLATDNGNTSRIITAALNTSQVNTIEVSWLERRVAGTETQITRILLIKNGSSFLSADDAMSTQVSENWDRKTVRLPAYANYQTYVELRWNISKTAGSQAVYAIDDIIITGLKPTITLSPNSLFFEAALGSRSEYRTYTLSALNLTSNLTISAPDNFLISTDGEDYSNFVLVSQTGGTIPETEIYVVYEPLTEGPHTNNIIANASHGISESMIVSGTTPTIAAPQPVELATFNAQAANGATNLLWTTASEKNNDKFIVERSQDGKSFTPIGEVKGSGNSATKRKYSFTDTDPANGINYYRLHQVDFDGTESFSNVVALEVKESIEATVYPTVATREVNISLPDTERGRNITVTDATGRPVATFSNTTEREINLPLDNLRSGVYFVRITNGQNQQVQRFIKQ